MGELSEETELLMGSAAPEFDDADFAFVVGDFPLTLFFESWDSIMFLINLGALGEHLQDNSTGQRSWQMII